MVQKYQQRKALLIGAAALAGLIGTLSTIFMPKRSNQKRWMDKARNIGGQMNLHGFYPHADTINKNLMLGGLAGGIVGITTALLLAPKSGTELMKDIVDTLQGNHEGGGKQAQKMTRDSRSSASKGKAASTKKAVTQSNSSKKRSKTSNASSRTTNQSGSSSSSQEEHRPEQRQESLLS
jgi:gas vesicle protein